MFIVLVLLCRCSRRRRRRCRCNLCVWRLNEVWTVYAYVQLSIIIIIDIIYVYKLCAHLSPSLWRLHSFGTNITGECVRSKMNEKNEINECQTKAKRREKNTAQNARWKAIEGKWKRETIAMNRIKIAHIENAIKYSQTAAAYECRQRGRQTGCPATQAKIAIIHA